MSSITESCPCGSDLSYTSCCEPFISGTKPASTPEELMRSRYTAFANGSIDYLKQTWHPETCPDDLGDDEPSCWVGLEIIETAIDDEDVEGEVEFMAKLIYNNKLEILHELSHFDKIDGKWLYHSGEFKNEGQDATKISKSSPCPCGSGKNFKNCHYEA